MAELVTLEQPLDRNWLWRGETYHRGTNKVPSDLAEAIQATQKARAKAPSSKETDSPSSEAAIATDSEQPEDINSEQTEQTSAEESPTVVDLPALELINKAASAADIISLPGIGKGAAERIFKKRPKAGYESFEQLCQINDDLAKHPYKLDWEKVRTWEPTE